MHSAAPANAALTPEQSRALTHLLSQRFGDGSVYLAKSGDRRLLRQAMAIGLVSTDGHVTAAGLRFLKQGVFDSL